MDRPPPAARPSAAPGSADMRQGLWLALAAYGVWGVLALFWKQLGHVPAYEQLIHRVVWAAVVMVILLLARGQLGAVRTALADRGCRRKLLLSATLLSINWFVFVYAVASDRVLHVSLGYYINPIVSMALGTLFLGERLRPLQWAAVAAAVIGVLTLLIGSGELPWIGVSVALAFGFYGLVRKTVAVDPLPGSAIEALLLSVPCGAAMLWLELGSDAGHFVRDGLATTGLLLTAGLVTALPILWFTAAARRLPLFAMGFLQYITPTTHFLFAVWLFGEHFTFAHALAFAAIWSGVLLFAVDLLAQQRRRRRAEQVALTR